MSVASLDLKDNITSQKFEITATLVITLVTHTRDIHMEAVKGMGIGEQEILKIHKNKLGSVNHLEASGEVVVELGSALEGLCAQLGSFVKIIDEVSKVGEAVATLDCFC